MDGLPTTKSPCSDLQKDQNAWHRFVAAAWTGVKLIGRSMGFTPGMSSTVFWWAFHRSLAGRGEQETIDPEIQVYTEATERFIAVRRQRSGERVANLACTPEPSSSGEPVGSALERADITRAILDRLEPHHRYALVFIAEGGTYKELAAATGLSAGQVANLVRQARLLAEGLLSEMVKKWEGTGCD